MARHTTFRFCLDPTVEQSVALARHVGAARFAFNQCLRLHLDARMARGSQESSTDDDGGVGGGSVTAEGEGAAAGVPWSRFALINTFNQWKRSEDAGRRFHVDSNGATDVEVTGLAWRAEVSSQVFEEAAVDLGRALAAWIASRSGKRTGRPVGHPRFKKKTHTGGSFRMRDKATAGRVSIRVGQDRARSVTLPKIGIIRVQEDTRRLRRMIATSRARILQATVTRGARRWWISITVEAAEVHPAIQHPARPATTRPAGSASTVVCTPWSSPERGTVQRPCGSRRPRS